MPPVPVQIMWTPDIIATVVYRVTMVFVGLIAPNRRAACCTNIVDGGNFGRKSRSHSHKVNRLERYHASCCADV
ncbi:predicted protein [Sclerotinia sclerotiorum 1980 UF-70]|uniref:Uncharacterized protein n=1 Tax=Sclerotinia sclerotiorum (strain ATCC 18683 / 1980 / Ss-1) TaxID=665079 RepID=A7E732_SCLS1|nr:predicted protein [Sclerotinia sclerotiorum 1980 UF-70]EDN96184.1 predicted protein [Sclerotinia sclerotiorum 1980 UF-70]